MKQLMLGVLQYTQDYDEHVPLLTYAPGGWNGDRNGNSYVKWQDIIYPYVKSEGVYNCPSSKLKWTQGTNQADTAIGADIDSWLPSQVGGGSVSLYGCPAQTAAITDGFNYGLRWCGSTTCSGSGATYTMTYPSNTADSGQGFFRHLSGANYAFHDGHVKWINGNKYWAAINDTTLVGNGDLKTKYLEAYNFLINCD
jgi:prepilin-type processing-associated H-X9-DG protein